MEPQPLAAVRTDHGLSQVQLAEAVGVSVVTIQGIERALQVPSVELALKISATLDVDPRAVAWPTAEQTKGRKGSRRERYLRSKASQPVAPDGRTVAAKAARRKVQS